MRCPWTLVPTIWKVAWIRLWVTWMSVSEIAYVSHAIASPPEAPKASTAIEWLPGQAFERMVPSVLLLHFISCMKNIWGLSCCIMFFIILYFTGLFNPLKFHDLSFMVQYWVATYNTLLTWNIFLTPTVFPQWWWFFAYLSFSHISWYLWEGFSHPINYPVGSLNFAADVL